MSEKLEFFGSVDENGRLEIRNRKQFLTELKGLANQQVEIVVKKYKKNRSEQQNRWWWACMTILGNDLGYTKDEMHEICKYKFLKDQKLNYKTGEMFEYLRSTAELTTTEFSGLMESVIQWSATELGIVLPLPNEQLEIHHE